MATASIIEIEARQTFLVSALRTEAELKRLELDWKQLFQRIGCDNVFLSYEWLSEWWLHFGRGCQLCVVTVRDGEGTLVALAPLYVSFEAGPLRIRRLGFLGDQLVGSDYLDFLVDEACMPAVLDQICQHIVGNRREWDYIELSGIKADSIAARGFRQIMQGCDLDTRMTSSTVCPYGKLPPSTDEFVASLSPAFRKSLRYYSRTLQREGPVEFATEKNLPKVEGAFDDLLRLHRIRFETRHASSAFVRPEVEAFHRSVFRSLADAGWVRIHTLKLCGKCIAASYELSCAKKLFTYQSGIDPAYGRFSVGQQLLYFAFQDAIQKGYTEFDFLRGNEPYKSKWVRDVRALYSLQLFDTRGKSRMTRAAKLSRAVLRACKTALLDGRKKIKSGSGLLRRIIG